MKIPNPFKTSKEANPPELPVIPENQDISGDIDSQSLDSQTEPTAPWYLDPELPSTPVEIHILDDCTYTPGSLSFL